MILQILYNKLDKYYNNIVYMPPQIIPQELYNLIDEGEQKNKDVKRIELDDRMFIVDSDPRAHGLFEVDFYTLYLKPVEAQ